MVKKRKSVKREAFEQGVRDNVRDQEAFNAGVQSAMVTGLREEFMKQSSEAGVWRGIAMVVASELGFNGFDLEMTAKENARAFARWNEKRMAEKKGGE